MRDSEYILDKLSETIRTTLGSVESRLVNGNIISIEDYKYNLGMRFILHTLQTEITELNRGN